MKILIYMPFADWVPHLATDLEIATIHRDAGNEVHIIQCSGVLPFCEPNPNHFSFRCWLCQAQRDKGLSLINIPREQRYELDLMQYCTEFDIPTFSSIKELMDFQVDGLDVGSAVASSLISMLREPNPDVTRYEDFVSTNLSMVVAVYHAVKVRLQEVQPDIFYLFNGRYAPLRPALRAAQELGITTYVHERAGVLDRYSLAKNTYPHNIPYQQKQFNDLWNAGGSFEEKQAIARKWYEERRKGKDQSWFSYTRSQKKGNLPEGFDETKRNIAIYISSQDEFEAIPGWENPLFQNQIEAIQYLISADVSKDIVFYLRIHPNLKGLRNSQVTAFDTLKSANLCVIPAKSRIDSYTLMDRCEKIISFGSSVGIESIYWGKASILVGRSFYEGLDACYIPKTCEELLALVNARLEPKDPAGAILFGYVQAVRGIPFRYYAPESVRGGKFMGVYLKNPYIQRIKSIVLSNEHLSRLIFNLAYWIRKFVWGQ